MGSSLLALLVRLVTGVRETSRDLDQDRQYVFFANHSSHLDFLVIWAALPKEVRRTVRPVAAMDYWSKGWLKPWLSKNVFRSILLSRIGRVRGKHPMAPILEAIDEGASVIIFPEGTRSEDGKVAPFKPGIHKLAESCEQVTLVPVVLDNLTRVLPKGEVLPLPLIAQAHFLQDVNLEEVEAKGEFLKRIREVIVESLEENE